MSRVVSFLSFAFAMNLSALPSCSAICSSISMTCWLAPPWSGPHSALIPAEMLANRLARELPTMRTVLVEQFCS